MVSLKKSRHLRNILILFLISFPSYSYSFLGNDLTGGMSQIYLAETKILVDGGFVEWAGKDEVSIRAKGLDISINIDNSQSDKDRKFRVHVNNINSENIDIIGLEGVEIERKGNRLAFNIDVNAGKVAVHKLTPKVADETFSFIVFGESKGGTNVFRRIIGDINYRKPLFAISCGDMVEEGSSSGYKEFFEEIGTIKVPFLTVVGSSEAEGEGRNIYKDLFGAAYYSFDFKNSHFIVLDNGDGRMGEEEFRWLENDLMQNKAINTFIFMHLPPFDPRPGRNEPLLKGGQQMRLSAILEKYNITRVFSSGIHSYFKSDRKGVSYVLTGGGGSELASTDSYYNYVIVDVEGNKVKDKVVKLVSPPLGWFESLRLKISISVKNSFQASPVKSSIYAIILSIIAFAFLKVLYRSIFKSRKKRKISL